jgi:hypothetical protein
MKYYPHQGEAMGERVESTGENSPLVDVSYQLMCDLSDLSNLRRERDEIQKRIDDADAFMKAAEEGCMPFGLRLCTLTGPNLAEVWRIDEDGEYTPYGRVSTKGVNYPFIADRAKTVQMGGETVILLLNTQLGLAVPAEKLLGTVRVDDSRSEDMFYDFEDFVELFKMQDDHGKVTQANIF